MPSLSHSQMEVWSQCPRKWALLYVDQVQAAPNEYYLLGRAIHAALEADGRRHLAGQLPLAASDLKGLFSERLAQEASQWDPEQLLTSRMSILALRGAAILNAYARKVQQLLFPIAVEEHFRVPIPNLPMEIVKEESWEFTGITDARTAPNTGPTIVDFKTAIRPWAAGREHQASQATAYLWADWVARRQPLSTRLTFIVFATRESPAADHVCETDFRPTSRTFPQLMNFASTVQRVVADISAARQSGVYVARPSPLCGWCTVLGHCGVGQQWLSEHGRTPSIPVLRPVTHAKTASTAPCPLPEPATQVQHELREPRR